MMRVLIERSDCAGTRIDMNGKNAQSDEPVVIKKYANRRLYNTRLSSYVTLDHLAKMTREGIDFKVLDAKSGGDITHQVLTQIIMDEEAGGEQMLPVGFLRQLIGMYGNSMQAMLPSYLEASMEHFRENQAKLRKAIEDSIGANPLAQLAQRNLEMFKAAATAFVPGASGNAGPAASPAERATGGEDEIALLRQQMAAMQRKLDELAN
jgi:polyhydroxyalkanoate synthesis repressor PhaR